MTPDEQILSLLRVIVTELTAIRRALEPPPLYTVGEDGVLTRVTDGEKVVPFRGRIR